MRYYGKYNEIGDYISFYSTDIWKEEDIPVEECIELTREEWQQGISGNYKVIDGKHTEVSLPNDFEETQLYAQLRHDRNKLLSESDWTQLADAPLTAETKQDWADYRQQLRDLPDTVDINNIVYPEKP